ncbi:phosphatidylethanolamine N-methyltransferase [Ambystoma mexicanum]|uniref:phosphatidylethanolamine N-methyltransferase n=1 Tax=Ambystoma mexicanum TaxID=8296 RepID=UPI0037E76484
MAPATYIDVTDVRFVGAVLCIIFNPLFWNVVARWEHKTRVLTRLFGSPYTACYSLGTVLVLLVFLRSHCFSEAMKTQPTLEGLLGPAAYYAGLAVVGVGGLLVASSFFALGFVGTYLGDYFGILMEEKVTGFPFNILRDPMYVGSTMNYLGWAVMNASPAGLALTAVVAICYKVALMYEGPFTEEIYQQREKSRKNK